MPPRPAGAPGLSQGPTPGPSQGKSPKMSQGAPKNTPQTPADPAPPAPRGGNPGAPFSGRAPGFDEFKAALDEASRRAAARPKGGFPLELDEFLEHVRATHRLVGLDGALEELWRLWHWALDLKRRRALGLAGAPPMMHVALLGNPGVGKTTLARLIGGVLHAAGLLERPTVVEADRSALVAQYVGQSAPLTHRLCDRAMGGVLFIDEAHSLRAGERDDFGREAVSALLKRMEDDRGRLCVVLAGYPEGMERLLESDPGLRSRVGRALTLEDYTPGQLLRIFYMQCEAAGVRPDPAACAAARRLIARACRGGAPAEGNGRWARTLLERARERMAIRLNLLEHRSGALDAAAMTTLLAEDLDQEAAAPRGPAGRPAPARRGRFRLAAAAAALAAAVAAAAVWVAPGGTDAATAELVSRAAAGPEDRPGPAGPPRAEGGPVVPPVASPAKRVAEAGGLAADSDGGPSLTWMGLVENSWQAIAPESWTAAGTKTWSDAWAELWSGSLGTKEPGESNDFRGAAEPHGASAAAQVGGTADSPTSPKKFGAANPPTVHEVSSAGGSRGVGADAPTVVGKPSGDPDGVEPRAAAAAAGTAHRRAPGALGAADRPSRPAAPSHKDSGQAPVSKAAAAKKPQSGRPAPLTLPPDEATLRALNAALAARGGGAGCHRVERVERWLRGGTYLVDPRDGREVALIEAGGGGGLEVLDLDRGLRLRLENDAKSLLGALDRVVAGKACG